MSLSGAVAPGLIACPERVMADLEVDERPEATQEGVAASGSVRVTVAADGAVADVSLSRRWPPPE
ncbi:hypothetical protein [Krasilnikovia sp. M28-CT-15]|uniref:hypothetical protein n=1 Tax=Krasilnikovia sp. M28-CT-15 TaxID=3373540 RepID=UPI00399D4F00